MCPLLVANNGDVTDYTQPLNVADDLSLITLNTPVSLDNEFATLLVNYNLSWWDDAIYTVLPEIYYKLKTNLQLQIFFSQEVAS